MKTVVLSLIFVGVAGGTWTWVVPKQGPYSGAVVTAPDPVTDAREQVGLRKMLTDHPVLEMADLVIGTAGADGLRDFRARVQKHGQSRPAYGQARKVCSDNLEAAECWEIAHLEIDGRSDLAAASAPHQTIALATPDTDQTPGPDDSTIETADLPSVQPREVTPTANERLEVPVADPTHRVSKPVINARSGPGTENPVVTKLHRGTDLFLLSQQDGWGRFLVMTESGDTPEVWAALRILEDLR